MIPEEVFVGPTEQVYPQKSQGLIPDPSNMSALVASRHNPILKALYQRLLTAGKPKKLALTALMRKLIILANRLLKNPNFSLAN